MLKNLINQTIKNKSVWNKVPKYYVSSTGINKSCAEMLCMQCQQTENGTGCTTVGVCSKTPEVASLQDLLVDQLKRLCVYAVKAKLDETEMTKVGHFTAKSMFSTMTNVNFDGERMKEEIKEAVDYTEYISKKTNDKLPERTTYGITVFLRNSCEVSQLSLDELAQLGRKVGVDARKDFLGEEGIDLWSARELITYGIKGVSAYSDHASELDLQDPTVYRNIVEGLDAISPFGKNETNLNNLLGLALDIGGTNVRAMQMLDEAHTQKYGPMTPTEIDWGTKEGPGILVSGHDIRDFYEICKLAEGTGIKVYSHGELLPVGGRPEVNKLSSYGGHYGSAWQNQRTEFSLFPGPIVLTTNCLMEPRKSYKNRLFTRSTVGFPGVKHLKTREDFKQIIDMALLCPPVKSSAEQKKVTTGFGHEAVLGVADKIVQAVKDGAIKNFLVAGGCDGSSGERSYFRDIALQAPKDSVILTLGCGKYRFLDQQENLGTIGGIPRLLDVGQCNDAYSAVVIANALKDAFNLNSVNELPLSFYISWYEQKAVAVLLSLLHLGIKNIKLGPTLPAFVSPNILTALVDKFNISPISNAADDLKQLLSK